jgi:uroporphyrinogen-III synthase
MSQEQRPGFAGLRVVAFESRRADAMAQLITTCGGEPRVAPSMREVSLEENADALAFADEVLAGRVDVMIFLTGVGTRLLARTVESRHPLEQWVAALTRTVVVARGPKPVAALKEMGVPVSVTVPPPNTWRELLAALDARRDTIPLAGRRVAVQEYGVPNPELVEGLRARRAEVRSVHVYDWALPHDTAPLRDAIRAIAAGETEVVLFTTSVQVVHLFQLAREMNLEEGLRRGLARMVIGSIGPTTTETLRSHGLERDFEPSQPKMGVLATELSARAAGLLAAKR